MGWLRATPTDKNIKEPKSRLEYRQLKGFPIHLPTIDNYQHILEHMDEVGLSKAGMSGLTCISWSDIESWANMTHTALEPWETRLLMTLSKEYCYQFNISDKLSCPAPYDVDNTEDEMVVVRAAADDTIRGLF